MTSSVPLLSTGVIHRRRRHLPHHRHRLQVLRHLHRRMPLRTMSTIISQKASPTPELLAQLQPQPKYWVFQRQLELLQMKVILYFLLFTLLN